jgi:hypothetical protein
VARLTTAIIGMALATAAGCVTPNGYDRPDAGGTGSGGAPAQGGSTGAAGATGSGGAAGAPAGTGGATTGTGGTAVATGGKGGTGALGGTTGKGGAVGTGGVTTTTGTGGTITSLDGGTVLYSDDFESDTVNTQANNWIFDTIDSDPSNGTFTVVSDNGNQALQGAANSSSWIMDIGGDVAWTDYTFQTDIKFISGSSYEFGVFGRFAVGTDKGNYYTAYMDDSGAVQLRVRLNGSTTTLGTKSKSTTGSPVAGMVYTFAISLHGSNISVSVNGTPRVTMVMDTTLSAGGIGLIVNNGTVEFDNVLVTK